MLSSGQADAVWSRLQGTLLVQWEKGDEKARAVVTGLEAEEVEPACEKESLLLLVRQTMQSLPQPFAGLLRNTIQADLRFAPLSDGQGVRTIGSTAFAFANPCVWPDGSRRFPGPASPHGPPV